MRWLALLVVAACSGSDAATADVVVAGPSVFARPAEPPLASDAIDLDGDASGAWWDAASHALLLTDSTHATLERWSAGGFAQAAALPDPHAELGGLAVLPDGRVLITSFGFGKDGGVYVIGRDGSIATVPNLARERRRIGIAVAPDGAIYVTYFVVASGGKRSGGVARLDLATGETELGGNLAKPVGVAATERTVYVADEERGQIVGYPVGDAAHPTVIADHLRGADLLTVLPGGDLVTGGKRGEVYRITPAGAVTTIARGYEQVRGTAYDAASHKLFVVDHSVARSRHKLHIVDLD